MRRFRLSQPLKFCLLISLSISACGDKKEGDSPSIIDELIGDWLRGDGDGCVANEAKTSSTKTTLTFAADFTYIEKVEAFSDAECKAKAISVDQYGKTNILGLADKVDDIQVDAIKITRSISKFELQWMTDTGVTEANANDGYCGLTGWEKEVAKEVTDLTCLNSDGVDISSVYKSRSDGVQNRDKDIYKVSEEQTTLTFGNQESRKNLGDPEDECKRLDASDPEDQCFPTELSEDTTQIYNKITATE